MAKKRSTVASKRPARPARPARAHAKAAAPSARRAPKGAPKKSRTKPVYSPDAIGTGDTKPKGRVRQVVTGGSPEFAKLAARLLRDLHCTDVTLLDVRGRSSLADYLVIGTGTSDRQMRSVADAVKHLAHGKNEPVLSVNADDRTTWVLVDCVETVVHIFEPNTRLYYDLEGMYADAQRLPWSEIAEAKRKAESGSQDTPAKARAEVDAQKARAKSRTTKRSE